MVLVLKRGSKFKLWYLKWHFWVEVFVLGLPAAKEVQFFLFLDMSRIFQVVPSVFFGGGCVHPNPSGSKNEHILERLSGKKNTARLGSVQRTLAE